MADFELPKGPDRAASQEEIASYDFKGRDPRGLLIEKDIHIDVINKKMKTLSERLYEVSRKNIELEQEIS